VLLLPKVGVSKESRHHTNDERLVSFSLATNHPAAHPLHQENVHTYLENLYTIDHQEAHRKGGLRPQLSEHLAALISRIAAIHHADFQTHLIQQYSMHDEIVCLARTVFHSLMLLTSVQAFLIKKEI
jgi:hypothetical protein